MPFSVFTQIIKKSPMYFDYSADGNPFHMSYNGSFYYFVLNGQGDVIALLDSSGNTVVEYTYDPWGKVLSVTGTLAGTLGQANPIRYRGYYYDSETGFYFLQSRYYDPETGRFLNADEILGANQDSSCYNIFAYCSNNPISYYDPSGNFILTAIVVGLAAGAVIGGAIGGVVSYNSAKSSGMKGSDLFWATAGGIGKGALIGSVAGGLVGATGGTVLAYGAGSVAATAMITGTATITARATETTVLQAKKSKIDGKSGWQIANDCLESISINSGKILSPVLTKSSATFGMYIYTDLSKHQVIPLEFNTYLKSPSGKALSYGFAAYAWLKTIGSIVENDPIARAKERGYTLR